MKRILIIISFAVTFGSSLQAQTNNGGIAAIVTSKITSDSVNGSPNSDFEKRIKIKPIDQSESEFEIRFYKHFSLSNTNDLKIIKYNNGDWQATRYEEWNKPVKIKKGALAPTTDFDTFIQSVLDRNILTLPDQSKLEDKMKKPTTLRGRPAYQKIQVTDGHSYTVEIKQGDVFRIYRFHSPGRYAEFYDNVEELKDYVAITKAFEEQLKIK